RPSMKPLSLSLRVLVSWFTGLRMLGSTPPWVALVTSACSEPVAAVVVPAPAPGTRCWVRPASAGDSASLAWSAGDTSCGRGSPRRGGRQLALGGEGGGERETDLEAPGQDFFTPPPL